MECGVLRLRSTRAFETITYSFNIFIGYFLKTIFSCINMLQPICKDDFIPKKLLHLWASETVRPAWPRPDHFFVKIKGELWTFQDVLFDRKTIFFFRENSNSCVPNFEICEAFVGFAP